MIINDSLIFAALVPAIAVVPLICLVIIILAAVAYKSFHWSNLVFLILTAIAAIFAAAGMAKVNGQRTEALKKYNKELERVEKWDLELEQAQSGDVLSVTNEPGTQRYIDEVLSRVMIGRGRSWPNGAVTQDGQNIKFTFQTERTLPAEVDPDVDPVGAATAAAVRLKDFKLFAFQEREGFPARFVGTFRVVDETAQELTLEIIAEADSGQMLENIVEIARLTQDQQLFQDATAVLQRTSRPSRNPQGTWTLFEKMPQDRNGIFRDAIIASAEANPGKNTDFDALANSVKTLSNPQEIANAIDISLFRKILKANYLPATGLNYAENSAEYEALLDQYSFDGMSMGKIQNWIDSQPDRFNKRFEPLPRELFYQFKFVADTDQIKNLPISVDAPSGSLKVEGLFGDDGGAIVSENKNNKDVEFKKDDVVLIDSLSAEGYQRTIESRFQGFKNRVGGDGNPAVEEIGRVYIRQVRDYPYLFGEIKLQSEDALAEIIRTTNAIQTQMETNAKAEKQKENRNLQIAEAIADQDLLQKDLDEIKTLRAAREQEIEQKRQQISSLKKDVQVVYSKLREWALKVSQQAFASR